MAMERRNRASAAKDKSATKIQEDERFWAPGKERKKARFYAVGEDKQKF
jgi:hypothetical protein